MLLGQRPLRKVFTKEQRALYRDHAPEGIGLDDLAVLGPIFVLKLKWKPPDHARKLVAEMWLYPSGERIFELSTRCLPSEAFQVAAEVRVFLNAHGVDTSGEQQTKTRNRPRVLRCGARRRLAQTGAAGRDVPARPRVRRRAGTHSRLMWSSRSASLTVRASRPAGPGA